MIYQLTPATPPPLLAEHVCENRQLSVVVTPEAWRFTFLTNAMVEWSNYYRFSLERFRPVSQCSIVCPSLACQIGAQIVETLAASLVPAITVDRANRNAMAINRYAASVLAQS